MSEEDGNEREFGARVYLGIYADTETLSDITETLGGLEPDREASWNKGDPDPVGEPQPTSYWETSTESGLSDIGGGVERLFEELEERLLEVQPYPPDWTVRITAVVYIARSYDWPGCSFEPDLLRRMAELEATFEVDTYPKPAEESG